MNLGGLAVTSTGSALDPFTASVNSATRTWTDADVDFVPECDLTSPVANGECGLISNTNFGRTSVTTHWDPDYLTGWGKRGFNWEGSVSLQQQVRPGMSVDVAYYRRWYGNHTGTDNLLTTSADFDPYCVNVAADPRRPNPGGYSLCGLYEIKPALFGRFDNLVSPVERFGKITEYWHGVDINVDVRAVRGVQLSGGMSIGRGVLDTCDVASKVDNPAGTTVSAMGLSTLARPTRCIAIRRFRPSHLQVQRHRALSDVEFASPRVFKTIRALRSLRTQVSLRPKRRWAAAFRRGSSRFRFTRPGRNTRIGARRSTSDSTGGFG